MECCAIPWNVNLNVNEKSSNSSQFTVKALHLKEWTFKGVYIDNIQKKQNLKKCQTNDSTLIGKLKKGCNDNTFLKSQYDNDIWIWILADDEY